MRSGCITHPGNDPLIIIRQWQVEFCEGNLCAAALLSFLEYWHNIKTEQSNKARQANNIAQMHGDEANQDDSLWQWHTAEELEAGLMIYGRDAIRDAVRLLEAKGVITTGRNPNPRYHFDKTRFFLLDPKPINQWLETVYRSAENRTSSAENPRRSTKKQRRSSENPSRSSENPPAITEITTEITVETSEEIISDDADASSLQEQKPLTPHQEIFGAICEAIGWDYDILSKNDKARVGDLSSILKKAGYTKDDIRTFMIDIWFHDWRWTKYQQRPTLEQLRQEIGKVKAGIPDIAMQNSNGIAKDKNQAAADRVRANLIENGKEKYLR